MVTCNICQGSFRSLTNTHLRRHNLTVSEYQELYHVRIAPFVVSKNDLAKDDPRYITWRESLKNRPPVWSKGLTKNTHPSLAKTSQTLKQRPNDNFSGWRDNMRRQGVLPTYEPLIESNAHAFLIGLILGDGHLYSTERTEGLRITLGTDKPMLVEYTVAKLVEVFGREPAMYYPKRGNFCVIRFYQKHLARRLEVPLGNRGELTIVLPTWIINNSEFLRWCVRGLYEAEGSYSVHEPTYTHKLIFSNRNDSLLKIVYTALISFGFHPHESRYAVQVSRKQEVEDLRKFLAFRDYSV